MKRNNLLYILVAIILSSCQNMLDIYPHSAVAPESVTEKDLPALEMGMYLTVQNNPPTESWIMNDLLGGDLTTSSSNPFDLINNTLSPLSGIVVNSYNGYYTALYQVNNVLSVVNNLPGSEQRDRIKGTAHYFRALIYYYLVTRWGDVPILENTTSELKARDASVKVWEFIIANINDAISLLGSSNGYYYVSQDAAIALKARIMLSSGQKAEAARLAESLIDSKKYKLDTFDKIFRKKQNSEIIFAFVNHTEESTNSISNLFYTYAHPNKGSYMYRPSQATMDMYEITDARKAISVDASTGNNVINKYSSGQGGRDPFIISRLAELYLISAESQGRETGLIRLNELRENRGLKAVYPKTDDEFIKAILFERRKELLGEGFMYYDLVRTGKAIDELGLLPYQVLLPIPNSELRANDKITQNPGY